MTASSPSTPRREGAARRVLLPVLLALAAAAALAACSEPAHKKDTNFSEYNYQYNK